MPTPFKGTINGTVMSQVYTLPFMITYCNIVNKNAGTTTLNLSVYNGSTDVLLLPQNLQLSEGDMVTGDFEQVMEAGNQIKVSTNASVDYYFTIKNIQPDIP